MADFKISILKTLQHEGGYVEDPVDAGGATNGGITQADMPGRDLKTLTENEKINYYSEHYWKQLYFEINDQLIADKLFDMGVLFGIGTAVKKIQQALGITEDGVFGPLTLLDCNGADAGSLLRGFKTLMTSHALGIVSAKPADSKFITGWLRRINS